MKMCTKVSLFFLLSSILAGCGGGGTSSNTDPAPLATQTRALQVGDQWVYAITGQGQNAAGQPITGTGIWTYTISSKPFNGGTALARTSSVRITTSDGQTNSTDSTIYFSQDAISHDIFELGDDLGLGTNPIHIAVTPVKIVFGSWAKGRPLQPIINFDGGTVESGGTLNVLGSEPVVTKIGSYNAWKVTVNGGNGADFTESQDWAPQLGAPVQFTNLPISFGSIPGNTASLRAVAVLQSTTVPH